MQDLTVTLIQADLIWEAGDANLEMFSAHMDAIQEPCDLIVLPEMFSTGFSMAAHRLAQSMDGRVVTWLKAKAAAKRAVIAGSAVIRDAEGFRNRLLWATPDGRVLSYDKKHLFAYAGEEKIYTAGRRMETWELKGWRIRPFICYDLRFPIWSRNVPPLYDVAVYVANWPARRTRHWRQLLPARAVENQVYVVGVNRVGVDGNGHDYDGASAVIAPTGDLLFEAGAKAGVRTITLSRHQLDSYRKSFPVLEDADIDLLQ